MTGILSSLLGSLAIAALCTLGDYIWVTYIPTHKASAGLAHGALLCLAIGLYLGVLRRQPLRGALGGVAIGLLAAASFYALARRFGYSAMFLSWMALWAGFGLLYGRWLGAVAPWRESLLRGFAAAIASGLAFYAVSGIWMPFDPKARGYAYHFACWTIAFWPGFLALLLARRAAASPATVSPE